MGLAMGFNFVGIMLCIIGLTVFRSDFTSFDFILWMSLAMGSAMFLPWIICFLFYKKAFSFIIFSKEGIEHKLFGKQIYYILWNDVENLENPQTMLKAPSLTFIFHSKDTKISIDLNNYRRSIPKIISLCTDKSIKAKLNNLANKFLRSR